MIRICLILLILAADPPAGAAQDTIVLQRYIGNLKQVEVKVNGHPFRFLFDTGGGETFISPDVAGLLGKPEYGNVTGFRMSGEQIRYRKCDDITIQVGASAIHHVTVGVWDLMKILPAGFPKIDGVLSLKSFSNKIVTLDVANDRLVIETPASFRKKTARMTLVTSRFVNGHQGEELNILLGIPRQNRRYWFLLDSGNLDHILLSHSTAHEWGLESDTVTQRNPLGEVTLPIAHKRKVAEATSTAMIYDGALNYAVISGLVFVINFPGKQVWVD